MILWHWKFTKAVSTDFRNPEHCFVLCYINRTMHDKAQGDLKMWMKYTQVQRRKQKALKENKNSKAIFRLVLNKRPVLGSSWYWQKLCVQNVLLVPNVIAHHLWFIHQCHITPRGYHIYWPKTVFNHIFKNSENYKLPQICSSKRFLSSMPACSLLSVLLILKRILVPQNKKH